MARLTAATVLLVLWGCADGGGRGTGIGASTITGNIAATVAATDAVDATPICPNLDSSAMVSVRGSDNAAPIESDCTFRLDDVPPGDVTLDFEVDMRTATVMLNSVPADTVVTLTDVRLRDESTDVTAIAVMESTPSAGIDVSIVADPPKGFAPLSVAFSPRARVNSVTSVEWSFGDGSAISREPSPTHVYALPGDYVVQLRVAGVGFEERAFTVVRVRRSEPVAILSVELTAQPASGPPPLEVELRAAIENAQGAVTYVWDFGDGTTLDAGNAVEVHTYNARKGEFLAVVTVRDEARQEAGDSFPIVVQPKVVSVEPTAVATVKATLQPTTPASSALTPARSPSVNATPAPTRTGPSVGITPTVTAGANLTPRTPGAVGSPVKDTPTANVGPSALSTQPPATATRNSDVPATPTPGREPTAITTRANATAAPTSDVKPTATNAIEATALSTRPGDSPTAVPTNDVKPTPTRAEATAIATRPQATATRATNDTLRTPTRALPTATKVKEPAPTRPRPDPAPPRDPAPQPPREVRR